MQFALAVLFFKGKAGREYVIKQIQNEFLGYQNVQYIENYVLIDLPILFCSQKFRAS